MTLQDWQRLLQQRKGMQNSVLAQQKRAQEAVEDLSMSAQHCEQAMALVRHVAQKTQEQLEYRISELVSLAMFSVFDDPYEFEIEFVQKRGRTECEIWFSRGGSRIKPVDASGGGAVDVAAFALRIALWNLAVPKTANTIFCDEPLRFLSKDYQDKAGEMLSDISGKLGLQIIMITHVEDLVDSADKVFHISQKRKVSALQIR